MHHMIFCCHSPEGAPPICTKSMVGTRNVDGMWGTANLVPVACGYIDADIGEFPGDHVCLWCDIAYTSTFGHDLPKVHLPIARRL